ncbi:MAG TPA: Clp protease N-terminal domain-containing protein [Jiangellaceae bacterium]|nr:Clp protease N-terminal domain-containing protein [Jiangellaceae bacterium]
MSPTRYDRARDEARRARHDRAGTEHLVLALLADPDCRPARAIQEQGVSLKQAQRRAEAAIGPPGERLGQVVGSSNSVPPPSRRG